MLVEFCYNMREEKKSAIFFADFSENKILKSFCMFYEGIDDLIDSILLFERKVFELCGEFSCFGN